MEIIRPPFVMRSQIDSIEDVHTQQWQQEEFPSLLRGKSGYKDTKLFSDC